MNSFLDKYITDVLHLEDVETNKLLDLEAKDLNKTIYLESITGNTDNSFKILSILRSRLGKTGNTKLKGSSSTDEQIIGDDINVLDWHFADGTKSAKMLSEFITEIYKDIAYKGTNTLFLSIGAIKWKVFFGASGESKEVISPILIFPVRLIRGGVSTPVSIEFINDDIYLNPCLIKKLENTYSSSAIASFPHPNKNTTNLDDIVNIDDLGDGISYLDAVRDYVNGSKNPGDSNTVFEFMRDVVAITSYDHNEICTYYDIIRNKKKILEHPLVKKIFTKDSNVELKNTNDNELFMTLDFDSAQEKIIKKVVDGESLIIKGPPGTGKTQTITNIITSLLGNNKKVLLSSKKKSSLVEVYAKLPVEIKKFALLLEAETEDAASKINPSTISKDLGSLVKFVGDYKSGNEYREKERIEREKTGSIFNLSEYNDTLFKKTPLGYTYYECIAKFMENTNLPIIPIIGENESILGAKAEIFDQLLVNVNEFEHLYLSLTDNENHTLRESAWYGINDDCDCEKVIKSFKELGIKCSDTYKVLETINIDSVVKKDSLRLSTIYNLANAYLDIDILNKLISDNTDPTDIYASYYDVKNIDPKLFTNEKIDTLGEAYSKLCNIKLNKNIKCDKLQLVSRHLDLFNDDNAFYLNSSTLNDILDIYQAINEHNLEASKYENKYMEVFKADLNEEEKKKLNESYLILAKYKDSTKPLGLFDGKAKKKYEELKKYSFLPNVEFKEIVDATYQFTLYFNEASIVENKVKALYKIFHRVLTDDELAAIFFILDNISEELTIKEFVGEIATYNSFITEQISLLGLPKNTKLEVLLDTLEKYNKISIFKNSLEKYVDINANEDILALARGVLAFYDLKMVDGLRYKNSALILDLYNLIYINKKKISKLISDLESSFAELEGLFKDNLYVNDFRNVCVNELLIFVKESIDKSLLGAVAQLNVLTSYKLLNRLKDYMLDGKGFVIKNYTYKTDERLVEAVTHTFFNAYIRSYLQSLGNKRFSITDSIGNDLEALSKAFSDTLLVNRKIVENRLVAGIDSESPMYQFLASQRSDKTLRALFKNHPDAILSLKKCQILSPATASILYRPEEYESFDCVIIDEASQLEPVNLLPLLFRTKQVIIVGDEWQMPPIVHFKKKKANVDEYSEDYEAMPSALSIALKNEAFKAYELEAHFRSKTESLISFSQKEFYSFMKTFPSPIPRIEGSLGFKDIFVDKATVVSGANEMEANRVIEELLLHFDNYYNEKDKRLNRSIGVVAFGTSQIKLIERKIKENKKLYEMINEATNTFVEETGNIKEKIFFLKTIETVQGQEADHLILSMTYGVNSSGNVSNMFGTLNQGDLGKCVFNVSVTRAKYHITVIHSIKPEYINDNLSFIADYLRLAEYFSASDKNQFLSKKTDNGFLLNVGEFIEACGIDKNRIVYNYGVTEGSIRIPIVILNKELTQAVGSIWAETIVDASAYIDYNIRYKKILKASGWKLYPIFIHSWYDNNEHEKEQLRNYITNLI